MFDNSPADDNGRSFDALDANDADPDEETYPLRPGDTWTDVHGATRVAGEGWFPDGREKPGSFQCPHCPARRDTAESFTDHMMAAHDYAGMWESEAERYR